MATPPAYQDPAHNGAKLPQDSDEVSAAVSDLSLAVQRALLRVLQHQEAQKHANRANAGATGATGATGAF